MALDLTEFLNVTYTVKQGGSSPPTEAEIQTDDTVVLTRNGNVYAIEVTSRNPPLVFAPLTWDNFGNLGGDLAGARPDSGRIVRVSFYKQEDPDLKVLYGTIIDTDPDSVGAWSADDQ
jgi:hypothetical protein